MPTNLAELFRFQCDGCREAGSELYARLLERTIQELDRPGPLRDLLLPHVHDRFGSALALRFLSGLHRIVLEGGAPGLAAHYPSVGGSPGPDLEDAFQVAVAEHADELAVRIGEGVQTNEVGRSASLLGGLLAAAEGGLPLRVFEMGASAGLNLRWDHYRYESDSQAFGDPSSPLRFERPWAGTAPDLDAVVTVVERRGCDRSPIDATTDEGRLRLRSFVWPDLTDRFARLDAAIEVARHVPATVDVADAPGWVAERLAEPVEGTATVILHSIVLQYLDRYAREATVATIRAAGARATHRAPLTWLRMEPGPDGAEVRSTTWPGGDERLLALSSYHGPPVRWLGG